MISSIAGCRWNAWPAPGGMLTRTSCRCLASIRPGRHSQSCGPQAEGSTTASDAVTKRSNALIDMAGARIIYWSRRAGLNRGPADYEPLRNAGFGPPADRSNPAEPAAGYRTFRSPLGLAARRARTCFVERPPSVVYRASERSMIAWKSGGL